METKYNRNPELNDNIRLPVKPSSYKEHYNPRNPEINDAFSNYRELNKGKSKQYDASKYNDFHELQAEFKELRVKKKKSKSKMTNAQRKGKKRKSKINFEGEKFKDPDPYQLAVRKTQYGKQQGKFKFEGEKFKDPDPFGLAIRKQSSNGNDQNDKDVKYEFMSQLHHAHPGLVHGKSEYYNNNAYIADLDDDEDDEEDYCSNDSSEDRSSSRSTLAQFLAVSVKNVLLLGYGMTLGFPTIVIPAIQGGDGREASLEKDFTLSKEEISWLSSINLICVPLGCVFSGMLTQPIGRRRAMQIVNIPILIAWLLFHFASDVHFLYCGLALAGFSGGLSEAPVLTYVAEVTTPKLRGMLAATGSTCVIIGILIQFLMGSFLRWRTVALASACLPVISFLLLFLVPESPVWLAGKGKYSQAKRSLAWLRGWVSVEDVELEFYEIQKHMQQTIELEKDYSAKERIRLYTKRSFLQPFAIISLCFFIGHFSGMTTLQTYAVQIFHTLKAPIDKYYATVFLGLAELLGTLFCVGLVHYSGKRPLVLISTIGCACCFFAVAGYAFFLNSIPGSSVGNVVANVSAIKTEIPVIPLNHTTERLTAINLTNVINGTIDGISGVVYDDQSFTPYYLNGSYDDTLNSSIRYGEYVKSAIPKDLLVQIPNANENKYLWLPLTLLLASAFLTHIGIRLIPWILIGELFTPSIRSGASGIAGGTGYIFGFLANKLFLKMLATLTLPGTFWVYSAITFLGAAALYKILPETEGKTLVEIEAYFMSERKRSIHLDVENPPPKPKPRGFATAFAPPPPLPPRPHPLKDDVGRIRKISQQFGAQSRKSSTTSNPRKTSRASAKTSVCSNKSSNSSKGSVCTYNMSGNDRKPSRQEKKAPLPVALFERNHGTLTISEDPKEIQPETPSTVQRYRKISDSKQQIASVVPTIVTSDETTAKPIKVKPKKSVQRRSQTGLQQITEEL
uniref:Putative sugar transporter n=1 Tax=Culex tarsalis TaxID=7177 RepID=A0A1Q3FSB6_CULTA